MSTTTLPTTDMMPANNPPKGKSAGLQTTDNGQFANLLDTSKFEHMWRVATLFSKSQMVPAHYQNQPENCFIAVQMSVRLQLDPFMFMQNTYIVHGKPGMEAKLAIALINSSGLFADSLDYETDGDDPNDKGFRVRCVAVRRSTGKEICGPWIGWDMVKAEKWDGRTDSKWRTMPGLMFQYRAAMFFGRLHCPERLMGMQTADELQDVGDAGRRGARSVASRSAASLNAAIADEPPTWPADRFHGTDDDFDRGDDPAMNDAPAEPATAAPTDNGIGFMEQLLIVGDDLGHKPKLVSDKIEFYAKKHKLNLETLTAKQFEQVKAAMNDGSMFK